MIESNILPQLTHIENFWLHCKKKILTSSFSTIWEHTDCCEGQYICASALYLLSVMLQCNSVIIDSVISAPWYGKEVDDGINDIDKQYIYKLMSNVQLMGSKHIYSQILMHSCTQDNDVSLAK